MRLLLRSSVSGLILLGSLPFSAEAQDGVVRESLKPRVELSGLAGNQRDIGLVSFWVPLMQDVDAGKVAYGDVRVSTDNGSNSEFNIGAGYRQMVQSVPMFGDGIVGVHGWYDRRFTARGSEFNQVTLGTEWYADDWEMKVNGYLPLNDHKDHLQANPNGSNARFAGTQIVVDADQTVREEALAGFDLEVGLRVPYMDEYTDSTRVYAAGFHFEGDQAENVTGYRARVRSDITEDVSLGFRYQHDDVRGSMTFFEATLRFPFGNKRSYQSQGLWARMDESAERDIDIVSNEVITEDGLATPLKTSTTGAAVEVVHVDNTNTGTEDGSAENPYDTLAEAEAAAGANSVIYVHRGDGTTTGMNAGITLASSGQRLIGAGVALTPDLIGLNVPDNVTGLSANTVLIAAGTAPVITNGGGDGVTVSGDNVTVSGLTIDGATANGIIIEDVDGITLSYSSVTGSGVDGVFVDYDVAGTYSFNFINMTATGNTSDGLDLRTDGAVNVNAIVQNSTMNGNGNMGAFMFLQGTGSGTFNFSDNVFNNNTRDGLRHATRDTFSQTSILTNNTATGNTETGFNLRSEGSGMDVYTVTGNNSSSNTESGFILRMSDDGMQVFMQENAMQSNGIYGVQFFDTNGGDNIVADLGGGSLGSTGNNSFGNNTSEEIRVDFDGGELKAENNWWGVVTGLAGGETRLDDASTIDADPFLTSDPNQ